MLLQRLSSFALAAQQHAGIPALLQQLSSLSQAQLYHQHPQHQQQQQPMTCTRTLAAHQCSSTTLRPLHAAAQLQQVAAYSQRPSKQNPKEHKRQSKTDKRALKKGATPQSTAAGAEGTATSFADEVQAIEPDVTRLVVQAIHNVMPVLDVRTIRSSTNVNYVPGLMPPKKARSLALHWLVKAADARSNGSKATYAECLALELLLAYQKRGAARQKRDDLHKLALQNRANVHLRWW